MDKALNGNGKSWGRLNPTSHVTYESLCRNPLGQDPHITLVSPKDMYPSETGEVLLYNFQEHLQIPLFSLSVCLVLYKLWGNCMHFCSMQDEAPRTTGYLCIINIVKK